MKATKFTLAAATATKIATSGAGNSGNVSIQTGLTDLFLGENVNLTSDGAASFKFGSIATPVNLGTLQGDLWAISATGGAVYVLTPE